MAVLWPKEKGKPKLRGPRVRGDLLVSISFFFYLLLFGIKERQLFMLSLLNLLFFPFKKVSQQMLSSVKQNKTKKAQTYR